MSAFLLLGIGITFSGLLLLFEHCYFKYLRKYLARFQNTAWVQLISIDVAESLERTRQNNKMEGNDKNNHKIGENEIDECTNALDTELDEADEIQPDNGNKFLGYARPNGGSKFMGKTFQATQLTHERFLTIDHSW
jgi:CRISPR/Cas system Type II protein with McrA/HNH and RuvC-like nuclease domain